MRQRYLGADSAVTPVAGTAPSMAGVAGTAPSMAGALRSIFYRALHIGAIKRLTSEIVTRAVEGIRAKGTVDPEVLELRAPLAETLLNEAAERTSRTIVDRTEQIALSIRHHHPDETPEEHLERLNKSLQEDNPFKPTATSHPNQYSGNGARDVQIAHTHTSVSLLDSDQASEADRVKIHTAATHLLAHKIGPDKNKDPQEEADQLGEQLRQMASPQVKVAEDMLIMVRRVLFGGKELAPSKQEHVKAIADAACRAWTRADVEKNWNVTGKDKVKAVTEGQVHSLVAYIATARQFSREDMGNDDNHASLQGMIAFWERMKNAIERLEVPSSKENAELKLRGTLERFDKIIKDDGLPEPTKGRLIKFRSTVERAGYTRHIEYDTRDAAEFNQAVATELLKLFRNHKDGVAAYIDSVKDPIILESLKAMQAIILSGAPYPELDADGQQTVISGLKQDAYWFQTAKEQVPTKEQLPKFKKEYPNIARFLDLIEPDIRFPEYFSRHIIAQTENVRDPALYAILNQFARHVYGLFRGGDESKFPRTSPLHEGYERTLAIPHELEERAKNPQQRAAWVKAGCCEFTLGTSDLTVDAASLAAGDATSEAIIGNIHAWERIQARYPELAPVPIVYLFGTGPTPDRSLTDEFQGHHTVQGDAIDKLLVFAKAYERSHLASAGRTSETELLALEKARLPQKNREAVTVLAQKAYAAHKRIRARLLPKLVYRAAVGIDGAEALRRKNRSSRAGARQAEETIPLEDEQRAIGTENTRYITNDPASKLAQFHGVSDLTPAQREALPRKDSYSYYNTVTSRAWYDAAKSDDHVWKSVGGVPTLAETKILAAQYLAREAADPMIQRFATYGDLPAKEKKAMIHQFDQLPENERIALLRQCYAFMVLHTLEALYQSTHLMPDSEGARIREALSVERLKDDQPASVYLIARKAGLAGGQEMQDVIADATKWSEHYGKHSRAAQQAYRESVARGDSKDKQTAILDVVAAWARSTDAIWAPPSIRRIKSNVADIPGTGLVQECAYDRDAYVRAVLAGPEPDHTAASAPSLGTASRRTPHPQYNASIVQRLAAQATLDGDANSAVARVPRRVSFLPLPTRQVRGLHTMRHAADAATRALRLVVR